MLKRSLLATLIAFTIAAAGCGGGGGGNGNDPDPTGSGPNLPPPQTPAEPKPSATFSDGASTVTVGRIVTLDVQNFPLAGALTANIGGTAVSPQVIDGRVVFVMPSVATGAQTLTLQSGDQTLAVPLTVETLTLPSSPEAYLTQVSDQLEAALDELIATATGDELAALTWSRTKLLEQRDAISTADAQTLEQMTAILLANGLTDALARGPVSVATGRHQKFDLGVCNDLSNRYPSTFTKAILSTGIVVAGLFPPSPLFFVGVAAMTVTVYQARAMVGDIVDACLNPFGEPLLAEIGFSSSLNASGAAFQKASIDLPFNHNVARTFNVQVPARIDSIIGDSLTTLAHRLGGLVRFLRERSSELAQRLPADLQDTLLNYRRQQVIPAEANTYALSGISDSRIEGAASASGSTLTLRFRYTDGQMPTTAASFDFALTDATSSQVAGTYAARLNVTEVPQPGGDAIDVRSTESYTGKLSARFADRYLIVDQPARGTVTLTNAETGEYSYYTATQDDAPDFFTFRAENAAGQSVTARVNVTVDLTPLFEAAVLGSWNVYYASAEATYNYEMVLEPGGRGYYVADSKRYPISWYVIRGTDGYRLYEAGFWHYAFDSMVRDPLTLPPTQFRRVGSAGEVLGTFTKQ